jgi:hypothetical protein
MGLEITVDVFSGRPNPQWTLGEQESEELRRRLRQLPAAPGGSSPGAPPLGYRGIRVETPDASKETGWNGPYTVHGGVVDCPSGRFSDPERTLERWLLDTASPSLEAPLRSYIMAELGC